MQLRIRLLYVLTSLALRINHKREFMRVLHKCDILYRLDLVRQPFQHPGRYLERICERLSRTELLTLGYIEALLLCCIFKQLHPCELDLCSMVLRERTKIAHVSCRK